MRTHSSYKPSTAKLKLRTPQKEGDGESHSRELKHIVTQIAKEKKEQRRKAKQEAM